MRTTIMLNGASHPTEAGTLEELLRSLGFEGKPVVVEQNLAAVFPRDFHATAVNDGDRIEIVTLAAGG